ncbi:hypothetical protein [Pedobacter insulae]|uniref:HEAT repeat-containing protein n=1 Tax=Pedobacter insulae TaxID=414048 RepID=A0A1I2UTB0_9SPHI|nr:hypothetical protein [Pedobacter insulae]SFG79519.1 hypothetical protein SAMN04489864_102296 [Pedobacter insulae]
MNDPLKKYIQENREDFDHLEPSVDILFKIKAQLKSSPKERKGVTRLIVQHKWLVAAAILLLVSATYLLVSNHKVRNEQLVKKEVTKDNSRLLAKNKKDIGVKIVQKVSKPTINYLKKKRKKLFQHNPLLAAYRNLTDSSSASTRLAAILEIQESTMMSYDIIDKLTQTLNHDSNSNVRLAALNLMSKYAQDNYVNNAFMTSLSNQSDPLLQLNLIQLLSQTDNPKLDDKLYALANDPTTFAQVKDQAYLVLLNQNKL